MSDHFALVPRAFADRFFLAVSAFYACDGSSWPPPTSWWQSECDLAFEESVLFRHLHVANVPYRFYSMFEYIVTRAEQGGRCHVGAYIYVTACSILEAAGMFQLPFSR